MSFDDLTNIDNGSPLLNQYDTYDYLSSKSERSVVGSLSFLAACSLCLVSALNVINFFSLRNPSLYLLNLVQGFFGFLVVVTEGERYSFLESYGNMVDMYMKFLSFNFGKSLFFYFVALLSFTLSKLSVLYFVELFVWLALATILLLNSTNFFQNFFGEN